MQITALLRFRSPMLPEWVDGVVVERKGGTSLMRTEHRTFRAIEFAFVASIVAAFGALAIAGVMFGFQLGQWTEWQGVVAGMVITTAAVLGALFGLVLSVEIK